MHAPVEDVERRVILIGRVRLAPFLDLDLGPIVELDRLELLRPARAPFVCMASAPVHLGRFSASAVLSGRSPDRATTRGLAGAGSVSEGKPQSRTEPSRLLDNAVRPSGANARAVTWSRMALESVKLLSEARSQRITSAS